MTGFNLPAGGTLFENGPIVVHGGSAQSPGIQFYSARVGFYAPGNDTLSMRILGSEVLGFSAAGITVPGTLTVTGSLGVINVDAIQAADSSLDISGQPVTGGAVTIGGGSAFLSTTGGAVTIFGGAVTGTGTGGTANLRGGTSTAGSAGDVQLNTDSNLIPAVYFFTGAPAATNQAFFLAHRALVVKSIRQVHSVAAGGASTLTVTKDTGTAAPGAGTTLLQGSFNLNATANTVQSGTLAASAATLTLAAGDRLSVNFANAIQSSAGVVVVVGMMPG